MALNTAFADDPSAGVLSVAPPPAPPPMAGVLSGPVPVAAPAAPPPQQPAPGGNPLGGIGGVLSGLASLPGNYVSAMGSQWQDYAAQHQMNMQMAQAKLAQFKAQMAGLQEVRQGIKDPTKLALFDADPFAYVGGDEKVREATLTPVKMAGGESLGTSAGGISTTAPLLGITKDGVGYSQTPTATIMNGSLPTIQTVKPGETVSPLAPVGPAANGVNGGFAGIPSTPAPAAADVPTDPGVGAPSITGGISQTWAAKALKPEARAVAAQIASHPAISAMSPQDQANILTIGFNESRFDPNVPNNGQSAHLFQFQPAAWKMFGAGGDPANVNDQIAAEARMYTYNKGILTKALGREPTGADMYMGAMQGPAGGPALLTAAPGTPAVTALRNVGVSSPIALASIAGNLPGYNYHTPEGRQAANSAAMKMTAQQFTQIWANHFNQNQAHIFGGAQPGGTTNAAPPPQAGNVWANAPGGPTMSVSGQAVPPPPAPPAGNGGTYPTSLHSQAGDIPLAPGDPRLQYQPKGSSGFIGSDGTIRVTAPPVTESDFSKLGSDYLSDSEVHQPAVQRSGDLAALSQSIASLPPSAMQSQQALNTYLGSITNSKQPKPKSLDDFVNTMGISEATHRFLSGNTPGGLGQTITPDSFKQLYRTAYIATSQSNKADAARLAPVLAAAEKYGYDASPYIKNQPQMPAVPALMQDALPAANGRHVGTVAWSPKGPLRWDGKVWRPQ